VKANAERIAEEDVKLRQYQEKETADRIELEKFSAKLVSNQEEFKSKREISGKRLADAQQRRVLAQHNVARENQASEKTQLAIASRQRELEEEKIRHRNVMNDAQLHYDTLQRQVLAYHRTMMEALTRAGMGMDHTGTLVATHLQAVSGSGVTTTASVVAPTITPSPSSFLTVSSPVSSTMAASTPIISSKAALISGMTPSYAMGGAATVTVNAFESDEKRSAPIYE
jgi:hypothetical protein